MQTLPTDLKFLKEQQAAVSPEEKESWKQKGATLQDGVYTRNHKFCLPRSMYPPVVQWAHGAAHRAICAKCNPGKLEKVVSKHLAKPHYPFQRVQIDHIQMPKSGQYEYALVLVDMFSGWPEAFPVINLTAKTTAKRLLTEIVCRYGVPEVIESDQGPAFTALVTKEVWAALGVTLAFHTHYHPQSSGKVERMNGTLKARMLKMAQETNLPWPETFLQDSNIEDSSAELTRTNALNRQRDLEVQNAKLKAELRIAHLLETRSHRSTSTKCTAPSSRSSRSRNSILNDKLIEARADAEAKKVQSSFVRKQAEEEAQIKILQMEGEKAASLARLKSSNKQ
ncbi:uncharacterized protein RCH25_043646 [Pelodytes ibericus]